MTQVLNLILFSYLIVDTMLYEYQVICIKMVSISGTDLSSKIVSTSGTDLSSKMVSTSGTDLSSKMVSTSGTDLSSKNLYVHTEQFCSVYKH
jgi:hypothetical protein